MRVAIIGGGPAGLFAAILLRSRGLAKEVVVFERSRPDATFGFGIVMSGATLANLRAADPASHAAIAAGSVAWTDVIVGHPLESVRVGGNDFVGLSRLRFLRALQARSADAGVELRFEEEVTDPDSLDADLVIGADGVRSVVRSFYAEHFGPRLDEGANPYIWLGTARVFDGLAMIFRPTEHGVFVAHAYEYGALGSTFVVECSQAAWKSAGLDRLSENAALGYLQGVFEQDLSGAALVAKDYRWIRFLQVANKHWSYERTALLGDALHTAHFSIGSGTKLALESAIALVDALDAAPSVPRALALFETGRRPAVEAFQAASFESMRWIESVEPDLSLSPVAFSYRLMTRSGRLDDDRLRRKDPAFFAALEETRLTGE